MIVNDLSPYVKFISGMVLRQAINHRHTVRYQVSLYSTPRRWRTFFVEEGKLPWIILSEALSKKVKHSEYKEFYGVSGVPTMVLVDKEGRVMIPASHGYEWKAKLAEIFE
jgi:thioredoxin-related protein